MKLLNYYLPKILFFFTLVLIISCEEGDAPESRSYTSLVINNYISPLMFAKMYNSNVFILDESKLDTDMFRFIKAAKQIIKTTKKKEGV